MADVQQLKVIATADVGNLTTGMKDVQASLAKTAIVAAKMDSQLGKMSGGANQANNAMMNLGRVVQDAPFGFIGIANNINPLLESFQRLKSETGSAGSAFKALAMSMIGAGGLGFAVSVVTSLITVFSLSSRTSAKDTEEHKKKIDETKQAADNYATAIGAASNAIISHQDKLADLNQTLKDVSNNFNILSQSVVNQAVAQYLATQKEGIIKRILDNKIQQMLKYRDVVGKVREYQDGLFSKDPLKRGVAEAEADLKALNNLVNELNLDDIFGKLFEPKGKKIEVEGVLMKFKRSDIQLDIDELKEISSKIEGKIRDGGGLNLKFKTNVFFEVNFAEVTAQVDGLQTMLSNLLDGLGNNLSEAFTSAIKGGNFFGSLFGSILKSLGAGVTQLGIQVIAAADLIIAAKAALKAGGISGIGAGIALVALGAIISAAANSIKGASFATGVRNFSGGIATVGERGPERVFLPAGSSVQPNNEMRAYSGGGGSDRLVAVVSGQDLAFILTRAQKTMNSSYGI